MEGQKMTRIVAIGVMLVGSCAAQQTKAPELRSDTGRVVLLSDAEYARLQKLRQAVQDAEKEIAVSHGVYMGQQICDMSCVYTMLPTYYEYRGQFLFIGPPPKPTNYFAH